MKSQELRRGFPVVTKSGNVKVVPIPRSYISSTGICHGKPPSPPCPNLHKKEEKAGETLGDPFSTNPCAHPLGFALHSLSTCRRLDCRSGWSRPRARLSLRFRFNVRTFSRTCGQARSKNIRAVLGTMIQDFIALILSPNSLVFRKLTLGVPSRSCNSSGNL